MKKFYIETDVKHVRGTQRWEVQAETEEQAIELFEQGEGEFLGEEIEVIHSGEPRVLGSENL